MRKIRVPRTDALTPSEAFYAEKQLTHLFATVARERVLPPSGMTLFPMGTSIPVGARHYEQRMNAWQGEAKIIADFADDLPLVAVGKEALVLPIKTLGCRYQVSLADIQAGAMTGEPLDAELGIASRGVMDRKHSNIVINGDLDFGLYGVFTYPTIPRYIFSNAIDYTTAVDTIINEVWQFLSLPSLLTKSNETRPLRAVWPQYEFDVMLGRRRSNTDLTIAQAIMGSASDSGRQLQMFSDWNMEDNGPSSIDVALAYTPDEQVARWEAPGGLLYDALDPQWKSLAYNINVHGLNGGFNVRRPLEMAIGHLVAAA